MLCERPYKSYGTEFRCGHCIPCRIYHRRVWTHRMVLESYSHAENCFVTLTYREEERPESLDKEECKLFFKRFRQQVATDFKRARVRVFYCGEYGDQSNHAHYHAIIFGYPSCERGDTRYRAVRGSLRFECCDTCKRVHDAWGHGKVHLGTVSQRSCQYVARYVNKKMTSADDLRLNGRAPEFAEMSRAPGIAIPYVREFLGPVVARYARSESDIPVTLAHGGREWPLGRTLRLELKKFLGIDTKNETSLEALQKVPEISAFMAQLDQASAPAQEKVEALKKFLIQYEIARREDVRLRKLVDDPANKQRIANLKAREGIYKKRSSI